MSHAGRPSPSDGTVERDASSLGSLGLASWGPWVWRAGVPGSGEQGSLGPVSWGSRVRRAGVPGSGELSPQIRLLVSKSVLLSCGN